MANFFIKYQQMQMQKESIEDSMKQLEDNPAFKKEMDFLNKINALMEEFGKTPAETALILQPESVDLDKPAKTTRRKRSRKRYKNPHTGEECVTAGGNHKTLKEWREAHPDQDFSEWIIEEDV